ncbi:MAG: helix-turn-helix domain-containing protein [Actinobacteria bacterium]|nr:helix-turn-helix domain-containing protein [Actinomycetota bacterium]
MSDETDQVQPTADRWIRRSADVSTRRALRSTTRASIYDHLRETGEQQTVRDIAGAFDLHPNVARTHLETLADAGLVVVGSRKHPGGGRPAKVYLARAEAGADEIHVDTVTPAGRSTTLLRLLGEVIVNSNGAQGGRLEAVRQAAMKEGGRLAERNDEPCGSLREAADAVARVLRTEGHLVRVHSATDEQVLLSRVGGSLEPLHAVRGGLTSALEWGLLSGAFARLWRPVQLAPVTQTDGNAPGWAVNPASADAPTNRLLVAVAGRVDARNAPRETGVVRAMRAITALETGAVLEVLTGGPGSPAAFARWADRAGHELMGVERASDEHGRPAIRLLIRKGRT